MKDTICWGPWLEWAQANSAIADELTTMVLMDKTVMDRESHVDAPAAQRSQPCTYFAQGLCKWGSSCFYSHTTDGAGKPQTRTLSFGATAKLSLPTVATSTSGSPTDNTRKGVICTAFMNGQCRWGSTCYYSHDQQDGGSTPRRPGQTGTSTMMAGYGFPSGPDGNSSDWNSSTWSSSDWNSSNWNSSDWNWGNACFYKQTVSDSATRNGSAAAGGGTVLKRSMVPWGGGAGPRPAGPVGEGFDLKKRRIESPGYSVGVS